VGTATYAQPGGQLGESLKDRVPPEALEDIDEKTLTAASGPSREAPSRTVVKQAKTRAREQFYRGRSRYDRDSQPRDYRGRFREVLARLKVDLGESELNEVVAKVQDAEEAELNGDYIKSTDAATEVIKMVDRIEAGSLDSKQLQNLKESSRELGKAIAYLPLPQGDPNAKLRFSDLPPASQKLLQGMEDRIRDKVDPSKVNEVLALLNRFTSGVVQLSSDELQSELARLLTYLID
jgi:hypothetical protein